LLGLGAVPAAVVVALTTLEMVLRSEKPQYTTKIEEMIYDESTLVKKMTLAELFKDPKIWRSLIATGGGWFIYDIAYCKFYHFISLSPVLYSTHSCCVTRRWGQFIWRRNCK
jgi:hypothetical protein